MRSEKEIQALREMWNEYMKNFDKVANYLQPTTLEEVISAVESLNEAGDRNSYYYYFLGEGEARAYTLTSEGVVNDHYIDDGYEDCKQVADGLADFHKKPVYMLEDNTEIIVYVAKPAKKGYQLGYDVSEAWGDYLSTRYPGEYEKEPMFDTLEAAVERANKETDNTPHLVAILDMSKYGVPVAFSYNGEIFLKPDASIAAERDAMKRELEEIERKSVHVPVDDIFLRDIFNIDSGEEIPQHIRDNAWAIQHDFEESLNEMQWGYTADMVREKYPVDDELEEIEDDGLDLLVYPSE